MTSISALENIHTKGLFGDYENKNETDLLKISESKNLLIVQIVQYKNSSISIDDFDIDNLKLKNESLNVISNNDTRLLKNILQVFKDTDFAVTDLSHSRAIIELEGQNVKEVLKKGSPYNFNLLDKNNSINSTYNGIAFTVDMTDDNPLKIRLFSLRSFGESLYHSISDSSLEFGYKAI